MSNPTDGATSPAQDYRAAYQEKLADAIQALTAAARLPRPRLRPAAAGTWVEDTTSPPEQTDWAEFVTLALAGAAANLGGIDAVLAGRSGSWEADGVRQLLYSTVGAEEAQLWEHRTDPVAITLYVDELLVDRTNAWSKYDDATREIGRRYETAKAAEPAIDYGRYVWEYDRSEDGEWVPRDPAAPTWTLEAWREAAGTGDGQDLMEEMVLGRRPGLDGHPVTVTHLPKSPQTTAELAHLETERDARLDTFADLEDRLEEQRLREWTTYGEALKERVTALAAATPGLDVPVHVTVDVETYRSARPEDFWNSLESRLIDAAALDTPTPEDLPGTPLERLENTGA